MGRPWIVRSGALGAIVDLAVAPKFTCFHGGGPGEGEFLPTMWFHVDMMMCQTSSAAVARNAFGFECIVSF